MEIEFDTDKDAANMAKHGVSLAYGAKLFDDSDVLIVPTIRDEDREDRFKAIGLIDGKLWTAIHVYRGSVVRFLSVRRRTPVNKEAIIAIPADLDDPEDRAVSQAGLERAQMGRRIRKLRNRLGLSQAEFAARYSIPLANVRQYEIGRTLPPVAVRAYLKLIEAEPEHVAEVLQAA